MIDRKHSLPLARQAALLRLSRSSLHYAPQPVPEAELAVIRRIDALHLDYPLAGSRMLRDLLRGEDVVIGRELVRTMMRRMGIEALYRRPNTSKPCPGHQIYPYLLRGLVVERVNQVWARLAKILCGWAAAGSWAEVGAISSWSCSNAEQ
jgi:putative transposase